MGGSALALEELNLFLFRKLPASNTRVSIGRISYIYNNKKRAFPRIYKGGQLTIEYFNIMLYTIYIFIF